MRLYLSSFRLGNEPGKLVDLLDGRSHTAVIANADDYKTGEDRVASFEREAGDLRGVGLEPIEVDLREYFGKPSKLRARLSGFDLLWVRGGNVFVLRRAFRQSGAETVLRDLLAEDVVVYGGYSAGVCVLTPSLRGSELVDDPNVVPEGYETPIIWDCLGILPYAVLPHYKSDHPESPAIDKTLEYLIDNHVPFVALHDGEAIVRAGEREVVVGSAGS
jgi:dipeptidase E